MSDRYDQVTVHLQQMKSLGEDAEEKEKKKKKKKKEQGVDPEEEEKEEEQVPLSSPSASLSPDPAGSDHASGTSIAAKHRGKGRGKPGRDDKTPCDRHIPDLSLHGSAVAAHAEKNLNKLGYERALNVKGTEKILQGKAEPNGNYVTIQAPKNTPGSRGEDGCKVAKKRRPVTVDTSKAKTSLEALKISIKQLKWKEIQPQ